MIAFAGRRNGNRAYAGCVSAPWNREGRTTHMQIFRLRPIADARDPSWDLSANRGEVIVRAKAAGDARLVAAEAELARAGDLARPKEEVFSIRTSAFMDDKLYGVSQVRGGSHVQNGARAVLEGYGAPAEF